MHCEYNETGGLLYLTNVTATPDWDFRRWTRVGSNEFPKFEKLDDEVRILKFFVLKSRAMLREAREPWQEPYSSYPAN